MALFASGTNFVSVECLIAYLFSNSHRVQKHLSFQVFNKLIRRYKYLERTFEDGIKKVRNLFSFNSLNC